ncbi:hypothetical protein B0O80DRAFT_440337 [Mortierella sp. GBAus27b]|nr:hypothetical protein B0O80DRAFT_440337 [Mortierella sp. GBAus27b]
MPEKLLGSVACNMKILWSCLLIIQVNGVRLERLGCLIQSRSTTVIDVPTRESRMKGTDVRGRRHSEPMKRHLWESCLSQRSFR